MEDWLSNSEWVVGIITCTYQTWIKDLTYLTFKETNTTTGKEKYFSVRASKRGNSVYADRVYKRMKPIRDAIEDLEIDVDPTLQQWTAFDKQSKILMFELTVDPKRYSRSDAWGISSKNWNRFLTAVRKRYGRIEFIRTLESQKNGYPHIHGIMGFLEHKFDVELYEGRDGKLTVRLYSLEERDSIKKLWPMGFVNIQCPNDKKDAVRYITKYITKTCDNSADPSRSGTLSRSLAWFTRRRGFTVSRQFADLIRTMRNSNRILYSQVDIYGNDTPIIVYELLKIASFYFDESVPPPDYLEMSYSQLKKLGFMG